MNELFVFSNRWHDKEGVTGYGFLWGCACLLLNNRESRSNPNPVPRGPQGSPVLSQFLPFLFSLSPSPFFIIIIFFSYGHPSFVFPSPGQRVSVLWPPNKYYYFPGLLHFSYPLPAGHPSYQHPTPRANRPASCSQKVNANSAVALSGRDRRPAHVYEEVPAAARLFSSPQVGKDRGGRR